MSRRGEEGRNKVRDDALALPFFYKKTEDINAVEVGKRFRALRLKLELRPEELSEKIELSVNAINRIELGTSCIPGRTLVLLHELYGVDIQWLLFGYHCREQDILNALLCSSDSVKFDVFTRLFSFFMNPEHDEICFVANQRTATDVSHFAKWQDHVFRPLKDEDIPDDEVVFENNDKISIDEEELEQILRKVKGIEKETILRLLTKQDK